MNQDDVHKKIGQLMVFGFKGKKVTPEIRKLIRQHQVGGIILFGRNIGTPEEVLQLTTELQREAKRANHEKPLLICIDQENGVVRRLGEGSTIFPGSMLLGATGRSENAYITGLLTGRELKALGINWNLAPVMDVNNNPENPVIGVRSFGETPEMVSSFGLQAVKGMQDARVITTLKHFPGHGDTNVDSHLSLPVIDHSLQRLETVELKPFVDGIKEGADTVMSAHVYFPAIEEQENVPATLSKKVVTNLLREKLGFRGVVTTDCMEMNAISETIGTAEGAVKAIQAGVDLIMVSHLQSRQYETLAKIKEAIETGNLSMETIQKAYERVMKLKDKYLTWDDISLDETPIVSNEFGSKLHEAEANELYKQGITIVKNENNLIPLKVRDDEKVLVVYPKNSYAMQVEDQRYATFSLGETVRSAHPNSEIMELSNPPTKEEIKEVKSKAQEFSAIIIGTLSVRENDQQVKLVQELSRVHSSIIVVATRSPYDFSYLPDVSGYIATYEFTFPALRIAANAIFGKAKVKGKLPVTLPKKEGINQ